MMLPGCYTAGWERKAHECCGRALYPLTLGHARVLYLAGSPFVVPGNDSISAQDVLLAASVCCLPEAPTHAELTGLVDSAFRLQSANEADEARHFAAYVGYWTATHPKFSEKERPTRTPWPWMYAAIMMTEYGMSERDAWALPCAEAFWRATCIGVYNGNTEYATLDELDTMESALNTEDQPNV